MKSSRSRQIVYKIIFNFPLVFKISLLLVEVYRYRFNYEIYSEILRVRCILQHSIIPFDW